MTCTEAMAVPIMEPLSRAHPETVMEPKRTDPASGESMATSGGRFEVETLMVAEPTCGRLPESVADTVMVWVPEESPLVLS